MDWSEKWSPMALRARRRSQMMDQQHFQRQVQLRLEHMTTGTADQYLADCRYLLSRLAFPEEATVTIDQVYARYREVTGKKPPRERPLRQRR